MNAADSHPFSLRMTLLTLGVLCSLAPPVLAADPATASLASVPGYAHTGGEKLPIPDLKGTIRGEPLDEARGGRTLRGTPVTPRNEQCFPAEPRDLFWKMDMVPGPDGRLHPLDFDENGDGVIDDAERDAIRGRNTWLLWGGGNESFWGWLQEQGYGLTDFLILMDSRRRETRFTDAGLINQPGFEPCAKPYLGLYLDVPKSDGSALLLPPGATPPAGATGYDDLAIPETLDARNRPEKEVLRPAMPAGHPTRLFEPWTTPEERAEEWKKQGLPGDDPYKDYIPANAQARLPKDGLDATIYGYPSGIFGLRLLLNPDFFARTAAAETARAYWKQRVEGTGGRYYTEGAIHSDPNLVRPFRVAMSCGFCHVGPHPLNPPAQPNHPDWENLSSIIGDQYWDPQPAFGNLLERQNFLHHFLKSQAPGTIDTSLVSTDHINNTNIINALFDVPARLARAKVKPAETQSRENLLLPSLEDPGVSGGQRHFPMVLFPGEDSIGVFGALARVPVNIGVSFQQWARSDNAVVGFTPQRPFRIEVARANSVYWNVNEHYRVGYMAKFFTLGAGGRVPKSTAPMKLRDAGETPVIIPAPVGTPIVPGGGQDLPGRIELARDSDQARGRGRQVFLDNCAICHSSKQPAGFDLRFAREMPGGWEHAPVPGAAARAIYTLPMEYGRWDAFRTSPAYADYRKQVNELAGPAPAPDAEDAFLRDNFLSAELRVPVTLVGTYAGRALATNAMRGQVWDNFSSETFKNLPSVGNIRYYNPFQKEPAAARVDPAYGTNDEFSDGRVKGGPGYLRPASLLGLWATAPYFHNNALGLYNHDPSIAGRLAAFDDGIRKLLWPEQRRLYVRNGFTYVPPGDLRAEHSSSARNDPGYIYRLPEDTYVSFQAAFIPQLVEGLLAGYVGIRPGRFLFLLLSFGWWALLTPVLVYLIFRGRRQHAGVVLVLLGLALAGGLAATGLGGFGGLSLPMLVAGMANLLGHATYWLWPGVAAIVLTGVWLLFTRREQRVFTRLVFLAAAAATLAGGILANKFLNGRLKEGNLALALLPNRWLGGEYKGVHVGPLPRGTPVNLLMNLDPDKRGKLPAALIGLLRATADIQSRHLSGEAAYRVLAEEAGADLMAASKCPDFVLDHGHYFGATLWEDPQKYNTPRQNDEAKEALIAFLKTL